MIEDKAVLQIFVDAIDDRWGKNEKPKQLRIPYKIAKGKLDKKEKPS